MDLRRNKACLMLIIMTDKNVTKDFINEINKNLREKKNNVCLDSITILKFWHFTISAQFFISLMSLKKSRLQKNIYFDFGQFTKICLIN